MTAFVWALLAAFCWGFAPLFEKLGLRGPADPAAGVVARSIGVVVGLLLLLPLVPRMWTDLKILEPRQWAYLALGGVTASIAGQLCFYRALKIGDVSRVVPVGASYPVIACVMGLLLLREPLTPAKASGIALIMAGTYLLR